VYKRQLHVPTAVTVNGNTASYVTGGKTVRVQSVYTNGSGLSAASTVGVWRVSETASTPDYETVKVLDIGGRVGAATATKSGNTVTTNVTINGVARTIIFYSDGTHAVVN
jgi:hypothetical protein